MTDVLGLPLKTAVERLEAAGKTVRLEEVRCKKGASGTDARVIRTVEEGTTTVVAYATFQTDAEGEKRK